MTLNKNRIINKYKNKPLKEGFVFVDSMLSSKLNGELFFAVKRILTTTNLTVVISTREKEIVKKSLELNYFIGRVVFTNRKKSNYIKYLSTCKYLLSDVSFPKYFIKRNDQVYFNTWHGTPIKTLGIDIKNSNLKTITNVHKNFNDADKIVVNSDFLMRVLRDKYLLPSSRSKFLLAPYLKVNSLKDGDILKTSSKSALFMYTWRSGKSNSKKMIQKLIYIDSLLQNSAKVRKGDKFNYVSHHLNNSTLNNFWINLKLKRKLKILKPLDEEITANEAVYMFDTLITDFSSILFDASYLNKNVVLDWSSLNSYKKERGLYDDVIEDLPYKKHRTIISAINAIWKNNIEKNSENLVEKFNEKYSSFDSKYNESHTWVEEFVNFDKKTIKNNSIDLESTEDWTLFYPGTLGINGMTTSAIATIERMLKMDQKIIVWIPNQYIKNLESLKSFGFKDSENLKFISSVASNATTLSQKISLFLIRKNFLIPSFMVKKAENYFENEQQKIFGDRKFKNIIHFSGYEYYVAEVFNKFKDTNRIIYVHNDMYKEYKNRKNYKKHSIYKAYNNFEQIIFVSEYLMKHSVQNYQFFKVNIEKTDYINNPISKNIYKIQNLDKIIPSNVDYKKSNEVMFSKISDEKTFKIINVGRYSKEKNQKLLLKQFTKFRDNHPNDKIILLLVGSAKKLNFSYYNKIKRMIKRNKYSHDIYQFENINVFTLLRHSHVFVLPSTHEGFPMVNLEANLEGLHVISSNLPGNVEQVEKYSIGENFNLKNGYEITDKLEFIYEYFIHDKINRNQKMDIDLYNHKIEKQISKKILEK